MRLGIHRQDWALSAPFRIAGAEWLTAPTLAVTLEQDGAVGRGEAQGIYYLGETADTLYEQVDALAGTIERGITREELQTLLPPGGARNALDCALWDLECKRSGRDIWSLTGILPGPVTTVFTIGLETTPDAMAEKAAIATDAPILKIKLDADRPLERLRAIRAARPDATLVVDANQGWSFGLLRELLPACADLNLAMIEQPLPRGDDGDLEGLDSPVPLAADESCLHRGELGQAARRYDMINIKLDKTGGLTEALALAREAKALGLGLMVGNMVGTSLGMAPAFVVAQCCDFVDIDGPLLLRYDHPWGLRYRRGVVESIDPRLWG